DTLCRPISCVSYGRYLEWPQSAQPELNFLHDCFLKMQRMMTTDTPYCKDHSLLATNEGITRRSSLCPTPSITTSSSSEREPAAALSPTRWRQPAKRSCCSNEAIMFPAKKITGILVP